jgi:hypothetical protein
LAKKREIKTRDDVINLAQDDQAYSSELLRVLRVLRLLRRVEGETRIIRADNIG